MRREHALDDEIFRELIEVTQIQKQSLEDLMEYIRRQDATHIPGIWVEDATRLFLLLHETSLAAERLSAEVRAKVER